MADINKTLKDAAASPASLSVDGQSMSSRPLTDQIAATKYLAATRARTVNRAAGVSFTKLRPHGSVQGDCNP